MTARTSASRSSRGERPSATASSSSRRASGGDARLGGDDAVVGHLHENVAGGDVARRDASAPGAGEFSDGHAVQLDAAAAHPVEVRALRRGVLGPREVFVRRGGVPARGVGGRLFGLARLRGPLGGGRKACASPSTSRQPDDATRTPDELGTSKRLARVCSRDANQLAFRSRAGSEGKAAGYFTTRADGVRFFRRSLDNRGRAARCLVR